VGKLDLQVDATFSQIRREKRHIFVFLPFSPHLERPGDEQVFITNKESVKKPMGTKSFVQNEINAVLLVLPVKCNFVQVYSTTLK
jgi:hypothetical protein